MLSAFTTALAAAGIENPALEARLLLAHAIGCSQEALLAGDVPLSPKAEMRARALLQRRLAREPMAYILGQREFWGLNFAVQPGVLIPRPDSETLIEATLARIPNKNAPLRVLDLGTGSGCLLLALLSELPHATGVGVDVSEVALAVAQKNANSLGLTPRCQLVHVGFAAAIAQFSANKSPPGMGISEIIVANPPYIASNALRALMPDVVEYEPHLALDGGEDGLTCYREIAQALAAHTQGNAMVVLEIGVDQASAVSAIFSEAHYQTDAHVLDLAGVARCLVLSRATP